MRKMCRRLWSMALVCVMLLASTATVFANEVTGTLGTEIPADAADDHVVIQEEDKPYLALGADLSEEQRNTVLSLMGIDPSQLENYDVVIVTNAEEHSYLGAYIDASKIGSKSWSSVVIIKKDKGNGINISTKNISYCTVGMYKNALVTAGIQDADIIVAGPQNISGTAALVGVFKAYEEMTGETLPDNSVDTALNELVLTGELVGGTDADNEQVEGLVAYLKQKVAENGLDDPESIREAIEDASKQFDITLTEEQKQKLMDLLLKISELDLDVDQLLSQAQSIYDKIGDLDFDSDGFWSGIADFFSNLWDSIVDFFSNLFG
ncbi:MAG: DUF1002 domain-containing protein [Lachnospiraceae bacterium]|nr:DUF1002 domain-containing protein [Lachnospiraceae bacterium]